MKQVIIDYVPDQGASREAVKRRMRVISLACGGWLVRTTLKGAPINIRDTSLLQRDEPSRETGSIPQRVRGNDPQP